MSNTTVGNNSISALTSTIDLGPSGSLQFQFAKLQLAMAELSKNGAMDYIKQIESSQEEQKKISNMLQQARQLQSDAAAGKYDSKPSSIPNKNVPNKCSEMPAAMVTYMNTNGLAYDKTGNDNFHRKEEWEVAIQSLQARLDQVGSNTQQLMVFVQDYMGQYNSYLQGSNSVIQQANQTLGELARAR